MPNKIRNIMLIYLGSCFLSFAFASFRIFPLFINSLGGNAATAGLLLNVTGVATIVAVIYSRKLFNRISGTWVAALGGLATLIGAVLFASVHSLHVQIVIACIFIGMGWGFFYNATFYVLAAFTETKNRLMLFTYLSAFVMIGYGFAPVFIRWVWQTHIVFAHAFLLAGLMALLGSVCFLRVKQPARAPTDKKPLSLWGGFLTLMRTPARYPLYMVLLGGCVFTTMFNFQTTYAESIGMNYAVFYGIYALSVVLPRLLLARVLQRCNEYKLVMALLLLMTLSLLLFLCVDGRVYWYCVSSFLFGIAYGLAYPGIQTIAVNVTAEEHRAEVISFANLAYFIGTGLFPWIAGLVIVHGGYSALLWLLVLLALSEFVLSAMLFWRVRYKSTTVS